MLEAKTVLDNQKVTEAYAYEYDRAGNMVRKGNIYQIRDAATEAVLSTNESLNTTGAQRSAVQVDYTATDGIYVSYWEYRYNLRNRLEVVYKNNQQVARYTYDYSGKRIRSEEGGTVLHYIYGVGGRLVHHVNIATTDTESYVYATGRILAKIAGENADVSYYHHDNLGSTVLITNGRGKQVFKQDYTPFGQKLYTAHMEQSRFTYTGQHEDAVTMLYYYSARYYDLETGRFTRKDEYQGEIGRPQMLNIYVYTLNNPLRYIDSFGYAAEELEFEDGVYDYYLIQPKDCLWDISRNKYGSSRYISLIANLNSLEDEGTIYAGRVLKLPKVKPLEKKIEELNALNLQMSKNQNEWWENNYFDAGIEKILKTDDSTYRVISVDWIFPHIALLAEGETEIGMRVIRDGAYQEIGYNPVATIYPAGGAYRSCAIIDLHYLSDGTKLFKGYEAGIIDATGDTEASAKFSVTTISDVLGVNVVHKHERYTSRPISMVQKSGASSVDLKIPKDQIIIHVEVVVGTYTPGGVFGGYKEHSYKIVFPPYLE